MPIVSVIIPTYKGSSALNRAIDSVLCQSYKEIEIIVVDDNDPTSDERKNTEALMSRYIGDKRIRYIKHQRNSNGAVARNTGITAATGKYIAFLDDDDYYLPNRIEKSVRYLEKNRDAVGVYAGVDIIDKEGTINLKVRPQCDLKISDLLRKEMVIGTGSNIFVKSDVVKGIHGFDESFVRRQDIEFMIRVCHEGRVGYIPDKLIVKSENGALNHPKYDKMKSVIDQFGQKFENDIDALGEEKTKYYAMQYRTLFGIALYEHNKDEINEATHLIKKYDTLSFKEKLLRIVYIYNLRDSKVVKMIIDKSKQRCDR